MARAFNPNTYRGWRRLVLERDGHKCVLCGATERLECDHIKSYSQHPELRYDITNGRVLCHSCHVKTDNYGAKQLKGRRVERNPYGPR